MMTNDELAALSEAATQGDTNALTDLEMALVDLYRANQLVLIGPDAVEVMARAICCARARCDGCKGHGEGGCFELSLWDVEVRSALAALTGRV